MKNAVVFTLNYLRMTTFKTYKTTGATDACHESL